MDTWLCPILSENCLFPWIKRAPDMIWKADARHGGEMSDDFDISFAAPSLTLALCMYVVIHFPLVCRVVPPAPPYAYAVIALLMLG
jgi:hypothetical protein